MKVIGKTNDGLLLMAILEQEVDALKILADGISAAVNGVIIYPPAPKVVIPHVARKAGRAHAKTPAGPKRCQVCRGPVSGRGRYKYCSDKCAAKAKQGEAGADISNTCLNDSERKARLEIIRQKVAAHA